MTIRSMTLGLALGLLSFSTLANEELKAWAGRPIYECSELAKVGQVLKETSLEMLRLNSSRHTTISSILDRWGTTFRGAEGRSVRLERGFSEPFFDLALDETNFAKGVDDYTRDYEAVLENYQTTVATCIQ